ncbi:DEAD/DEAH box helicase family protein [Erysipelothrix piscisicarius]|uniref:DEAD/DEAH box helicase family protein n=1 Tax=Erysipelothrix piscisicarius TaxID=2485784 RepID=UPI001E495E04|nr:DEAD/DEAH box helicase family protein [Erysipelothrix piscisicarius]
MELAVLLKGSLETSYLDNTLLSNEKLLTNLLINDYRRGEKVLTSIQKELLSCHEFKITVAFVTEGGLSILANQMLHCIEHNIKGKIITSSYLFFNSPCVFRKLLSYPNLEVRVHEHKPLHSKGYIFHHEGYSNLIVGSSNLTQGALTTNNEWNIKLSSLEDGKIYRDSIDEFDYLWNNSTHLSNTWIDAYEKKYYVHQQIKEQIEDLNQLSETIKTNQMQSEALENLRQLRISGASRALVISATGTGKTFLAAFDVKAMKPKRMLFIIHRQQVARDAMDTFKSIIDDRTMGLYTGNYKDDQFDYLFTTIQTISKPQTLKNFKVDDFDYIVIDEAHRSAANTYINVMEYFKPKFILGMTATPERGDSLNIFELFDYNIAYEIRLQKALEENMLVPFHYFGITDLKIDGEIINDHSRFGQLVSDDRIEHILKYTKYYGHCGNKLKGLMFCSTNDEASELSKKLNMRGLRTISLSGKNSQQERENAIIRLTSDDGDLDYILTVDIFNEGIDIPEINQIVMLRSTESAIVFIQQLGRGLRLSKNKDYVVVIDFLSVIILITI